MFELNINPVLVELGPVQIRYYGLVYALGFLLAFYILLRLARGKKIKHFDEDQAYDITLLLILGSILGARLFFELVYNFKDFIARPWEFFYFWHGGMSIHGGIIGGVLATYYFCKRKKIEFYDLADIIVIPLALMLGFGRIANFINGELVGTITNVPWAVKFPGYPGYRHPSQLYEAAKNFFIFGVLLWMRSLKRLKRGTIFWSFIGLYGILRFLVTFYRVQDYYIFGIGIGQWLSLAMVPIAAVMLYRIYKKKISIQLKNGFSQNLLCLSIRQLIGKLYKGKKQKSRP